jgi:hypothetical protein
MSEQYVSAGVHAGIWEKAVCDDLLKNELSYEHYPVGDPDNIHY